MIRAEQHQAVANLKTKPTT